MSKSEHQGNTKPKGNKALKSKKAGDAKRKFRTTKRSVKYLKVHYNNDTH